jgi:hypothetical protein
MMPERTVKVDGNCFWMEADSEGGYLFGAPISSDGSVDFGAVFELDSRAFVSYESFKQFRESIRFLLTYERG